ncbi:butyrate kinase [Maridesulfovibrio hydrothermalis]|uniref:Probable butyrate kinase n=1 Tax=Maridesulfovibrio hydrothermalis AM13 = DSM 14728 TaxID=1121451 RepID=L0RBD3_9BACT|nr:butyrate kinase [Maridesulfovibrio hydrothermalis]CCO22876.1 putative butyrate kinase [Maridesulfovibrio hydrothermalis AM13 = DSM 14728]
MALKILVINPGSTSTKVAVFCDEKLCFDAEVRHPRESIDKFSTVMEQKDFRSAAVMSLIKDEVAKGRPDMVVGRGGLLKAIPGGPYSINDEMIADLAGEKYGSHPCNLGAIIAQDLAEKWSVPSMIMDPVVTDEMDPVAKVTGLSEIRRRSVFHALSQRGVARSVAARMGLEYEKAKFIVGHMGGGVSIGAHRYGKVVDVLNALDGEGPFSPERSGTLPILPVLDLVESGKYSFAQMRKLITSGSGLLGLLGTNDMREVEARIKNGDKEALLVFESLVYNAGKHICSFIPALMKDDPEKRPVDAIILTGGVARSEMLVKAVEDIVGFIAPVKVVTGLEEMEVMGRGGLAVLRGELIPQVYQAG